MGTQLPRHSSTVESHEINRGEFSPEERTICFDWRTSPSCRRLRTAKFQQIPLHRISPNGAVHSPRFTFMAGYGGASGMSCPSVRYIVPSPTQLVLQPSRTSVSTPSPLAKRAICRLKLSILSPPQPIKAEEIEIGHHGLLISMGGNRGLLLPQVPIEHQWDRETFLEVHAEKLVCRGTLGRRTPTLKRLPLRRSGKNSRGRSGQEPDVKHRFVMNEISISTEDLPPMMNCHCTNQHIDWRSRDS